LTDGLTTPPLRNLPVLLWQIKDQETIQFLFFSCSVGAKMPKMPVCAILWLSNPVMTGTVLSHALLSSQYEAVYAMDVLDVDSC
jgi:hypothetical protein